MFSPLTQITRENVGRLEVAWTFDTGDTGEYQANNLIVEGVLYTPSQTRKVIALNAATGVELWRWDPAKDGRAKGSGRQRGLMFWEDAASGERRLFTGVGGFLFALDARSGELVRSFGKEGAVELQSGLNTPGGDLQGHADPRRPGREGRGAGAGCADGRAAVDFQPDPAAG